MTRERCDLSRGDVQCPYVTPNGHDGILNCGLVAGHDGEHEDAYGYSKGPWSLSEEVREARATKPCADCGMIHPPHVDLEAQHELISMYLGEGTDPQGMVCRTCGAVYDGGMRCTYCGDSDPTDTGDGDDEPDWEDDIP